MGTGETIKAILSMDVFSCLKKMVQKEGIICKWQHNKFKKFLFSGPCSKGKALKYRVMKFRIWYNEEILSDVAT